MDGLREEVALRCSLHVLDAAIAAFESGEEARCNFMIYGCEVYVRPMPEPRRQSTYFWLGAEGQ